jgi:hypothetical protein
LKVIERLVLSEVEVSREHRSEKEEEPRKKSQVKSKKVKSQ